MNKDVIKVENLLKDNLDLHNKSYIRLDRQVWDHDKNLLKKYYKIKQFDHGIELVIDLNSNTRGEVISIKVCENYITTKELLKLNNIKK